MSLEAPQIRWSLIKNERLKKVRGLTFEEILKTKLVAVGKHPKRAHQDIMLFWHRGQIWVVPFVRDGEGIFLKTLYPSRKVTRIYVEGRRL